MLKPKQMRCLEFMIRGNMTDKEIEDMSWLDFVQRILPKKPELIEYLKEKKLYVNETVTESEEM